MRSDLNYLSYLIAAELEDSYDEWVQNAEDAIQKFSAEGMNIRKVDVDVNELVLWCKRKGLSIDGAARSQYAVEKGSKE